MDGNVVVAFFDLVCFYDQFAALLAFIVSKVGHEDLIFGASYGGNSGLCRSYDLDFKWEIL